MLIGQIQEEKPKKLIVTVPVLIHFLCRTFKNFHNPFLASFKGPFNTSKMSSDDKTNKDKSLSSSDKDKSKVDLGLLEEDDEFEEFPTEDWKVKDEDEKDVNVWEDNWDDDNVEDDFNQQLRAELQKEHLPTNF